MAGWPGVLIGVPEATEVKGHKKTGLAVLCVLNNQHVQPCKEGTFSIPSNGGKVNRNIREIHLFFIAPLRVDPSYLT